ncbi:hypothetical protein OF122_06420 [Pelagibacterium flavum]|uniref:Uncharacterized protein n=1 Tax=Pelagibacterium flavum TaxID=2984530 RepID=A0ABY6IVG8_9HYPH|nr:hypothetical protein [Pelagibacterium sp. YIM 151497]UYQ73392.1 hypothetical protein OF122_06420 [Pelagibacterium sp. YIM 151497]|tara:strand:- start:148 stop:513 length:366 start_codon:yes stop_codon:yes gene_type:complete
MADIDRDYTDRNRTERERVYAVNSGGSAGWWIGGVLVLAVLIIGFIALSGGEPAPVDTVPTAVETTPPTTEPAPMTETAPVTEPAPTVEAAPEAAAPVETAPAEAETAPAEAAPVEAAPAQ